MQTKPPNILMIICHDLGQQLGCYGADVETPNLDRLATEGARFNEYFCTAPQCSPSRAGIITGRYPHTLGFHGLLGNGWHLPEDAQTLPKWLAAAGYETYLFGFQHEHEDPKTLGYQYDPITMKHGEVPKILASYVTPRLCSFLRESHDKPFYISCGFFETHIPFAHNATPTSPAEINRLKSPPYLPDHPAIRQDVAELNKSVRIVDYHVGQILNTLEETGLADDTIVVFTNDHGIPFPRAKCYLYDAGLKTCLLMRWPGRLQEGRVVNELMSNVDLAPTLLELAGIEPSNDIDGQSMAGLLRGGKYHPRECIHAEMSWHGDQYDPKRCIRTNRWKFIRNFQPLPMNLLPGDYWKCCAGSDYLKPLFAAPCPEVELYDLSSDPHEQHNLADRYGFADKVKEMDALLLDWMKTSNDPLLDGPIEQTIFTGKV